MTESGFLQAQSDNLPKIDVFTMSTFFAKNPNLISAEIRGVKATRSARESYGDNAIGYVQIRREGPVCTVKAKITPEHNVRKKAYNVQLICDESTNIITSVQCDDCSAHLGGCKHAVAFIAWLHRRSEEPSKTSVQCYWKKSKLSSVGTSMKFITCKELSKSTYVDLPPGDQSFLASVVDYSREVDRNNTMLTKYYKHFSDTQKLSIHYLVNEFVSNINDHTTENLLNFLRSNVNMIACKRAFEATVEQSACSLWFELRYARITASKAYDAAHCKTLDGTLVESIFGASKLRDTPAMKRGRLLEGAVIQEVQKRMKIKIKRCGILLSSEYPVIGASPDGESQQFSIEIKCPSSEKTVANYVTKNNKITQKYQAQVQLQMHLSNKTQALFCVASPDFETSKNVNILTIDYDLNYCTNLLKTCTEFWCKAIFPILIKGFE